MEMNKDYKRYLRYQHEGCAEVKIGSIIVEDGNPIEAYIRDIKGEMEDELWCTWITPDPIDDDRMFKWKGPYKVVRK